MALEVGKHAVVEVGGVTGQEHSSADVSEAGQPDVLKAVVVLDAQVATNEREASEAPGQVVESSAVVADVDVPFDRHEAVKPRRGVHGAHAGAADVEADADRGDAPVRAVGHVRRRPGYPRDIEPPGVECLCEDGGCQ